MKFPDADEELLEAEIAQLRGEAVPSELAALVASHELHVEYLEFLRPACSGGSEALRISSGAGLREWRRLPVGAGIVPALGADVVTMGVNPDGRNINAGCGSLHLGGLQKRVLAEGAALGVAFDGDADRALFVCGSGRIVNGDGVLLAVARHLKARGELKNQRVVATSMSNLGLERALDREGISLARAAVGRPVRTRRDAEIRE